MRDAIGRWIVTGLALLAASALTFGGAAGADADEGATWQALGPAEERVDRLFTPTSGALFALVKSSLYRSDDGGVTWTPIERPADTAAVSVSPVDQQLLYAGGAGGVYRSRDGASSWERVSDLADQWTWLEVSPADPQVLYGVAITSPPTTSGRNRWTEFRVSRDAGTTWETIRTHHETIYGGQQPCAYGVRLVQPHAVSTVRVLTIEGCTGRAMEPVGGISPDAWNTMAQFPGGSVQNWGASAIDGGRGVSPERWYALTYFPGEAYSRIVRTRLMRSDDDGATWTTVYEADGGDPDHNKGQVTDAMTHMAYNPDHPDDVYAVFSHLEPSAREYQPHTFTGLTVKRSRDGGQTWTDLATENLPVDRWWIRLKLGIDGRYLYAATAKGVYRLQLDP